MWLGYKACLEIRQAAFYFLEKNEDISTLGEEG